PAPRAPRTRPTHTPATPRRRAQDGSRTVPERVLAWLHHLRRRGVMPSMSRNPSQPENPFRRRRVTVHADRTHLLHTFLIALTLAWLVPLAWAQQAPAQRAPAQQAPAQAPAQQVQDAPIPERFATIR